MNKGGKFGRFSDSDPRNYSFMNLYLYRPPPPIPAPEIFLSDSGPDPKIHDSRKKILTNLPETEEKGKSCLVH
jgi:hypothetical protein